MGKCLVVRRVPILLEPGNEIPCPIDYLLLLDYPYAIVVNCRGDGGWGRGKGVVREGGSEEGGSEEGGSEEAD